MPPRDFAFWAKSLRGAITKFIFNSTFGLNNDSQESSTVKSFWFCESRDGQWWECSPPSAYQCGPGWNPAVDAICGLSLLLILSFAPGGFSLSTPVFSSPQKLTFPNSNSTRNHARRRTTLWMCYLQIIIYLSIYLLFQNLTVTHQNWYKLPDNHQSYHPIETLFCEVLKGRFGRGVPPRRAFKPWPRLKTKIVHFATLYEPTYRAK